ncbi:uncharacterized protein LOC111691540 [Anoplophora glabripennis]|uniref:uncharacterized protein LOC111691540 n=1 Tax=Anoplophora glabripennis TaxID=217634 RepID=UPI000C7658A3|nr:uncharacterized protein LOC111691540 [Anoplophora glabripennis]
MRNIPSLIFLLAVLASSMSFPMNNADFNAAAYKEGSGNPRAYPQYYYYPDPAPVQRRQDEILDTAHRVVYTPIFRYKKKQSKQPIKRDPYRYRKVNRIMPAYLI